MTPGKASKADHKMEIEHPLGGKRYPAQLFDFEEGIAWIELGWAEDNPLERPSNPVHMVEGVVAQITRENDWTIATREGSVIIRLLTDDNPADRELINRMSEYRKGDREKARRIIESDLSIKIPSM